MTWAEFRIRSFAFWRMEKRQEYKLRELAWVTYVAPNQNPKKMKRSKKSFWPIEGDREKGGPTKEMLKRMKQVTEQYHKDLKDGRGAK